MLPCLQQKSPPLANSQTQDSILLLKNANQKTTHGSLHEKNLRGIFPAVYTAKMFYPTACIPAGTEE
jgi:hypothetical protein